MCLQMSALALVMMIVLMMIVLMMKIKMKIKTPLYEKETEMQKGKINK